MEEHAGGINTCPPSALKVVKRARRCSSLAFPKAACVYFILIPINIDVCSVNRASLSQPPPPTLAVGYQLNPNNGPFRRSADTSKHSFYTHTLQELDL